MNLVNEGVLPPNEPDDRDERREAREMAQERETVAGIVAEMRREVCDGEDTYCGKRIIRRMDDVRVRLYCGCIEIAAKRDEILMILLMIYAVKDYEESWATNEYKWCVRKCCERLGIEYQPNGRLLRDRIGEKVSKMEGEKNGKSE